MNINENERLAMNINERLAAVIQERIEFEAQGSVHGKPLTDKSTVRQFGNCLVGVIFSVNDLVAEDPSLREGVSYSDCHCYIRLALLNYWLTTVKW
jgi:hypothetical protein